MNDIFGDRMKEYEKLQNQRFMKNLPVLVRLDGKNFSKFTKGLKRPFDENLISLFVDTTKYLLAESNALMGYTQSDEITLLLYSSNKYDSEIFHGGKIQKIISVLSSMTTAFFNSKIPQYIPQKQDNLALFDCRAWQVPTLEEAANVFLWRENDASKNSISMVASEYYSHKDLMNKNSKEKQEMIYEYSGVNWNDYPNAFKRGTFIQKKIISSTFTPEEIENFSDKHKAKLNPLLKFDRAIIQEIDMPSFSKVINRRCVIFDGEDPVVGAIDE